MGWIFALLDLPWLKEIVLGAVALLAVWWSGGKNAKLKQENKQLKKALENEKDRTSLDKDLSGKSDSAIDGMLKRWKRD